jgi:hypothetical protein
MSQSLPHRRLAAAPATLALTLVLSLTGCANNGSTEAGVTSTTKAAAANGGSAGTTPGTKVVAAGSAQGAGGVPATAPATPTSGAATTARPGPTASRNPLNPIQIPEASQCSPGPGALPDGLYFGFLGATLDDVFEFDLACWFTGDPAAKAATADGQESPPPNDYYIRNSNTTTRSAPVASPTVSVYWLPNVGSPATEAITYNEWVSLRDPDAGYVPPIWITVKGGQVVDIVEQFLP